MNDFLQGTAIILLLVMFCHAIKKKKMKRFLLIESVLIIVFVICRQMYNSNLDTIETVMVNLTDNVINQMMDTNSNNLENDIYNQLGTLYFGNGFDIKQNVAFEYKIKDQYKFNNKNLIIVFKDNNKGVKLFNLEQYFNKKDINKFLNYYSQHKGGCAIKRMSVHQKENQSIIDQIIFFDESDQTSFTLGNNQGTINYYAWHLYQSKKETDKNKLGDFELMFFNSKETIINKLHQENSADEKSINISSNKLQIYGHYVDKNNSIKFTVYIDTPNIVLDSIKDKIILAFSIVQIILSLGYFIYIYLENEREKLNRTRDLFINAMAHEMKTPNAVILNSAEMLLENINPEKQHHYLKMIEDESKHMNNLLNQMLIYTRTKKAYQIHKESNHLNKMVEEVLNHYDLESKKVTVAIDQEITLQCDRQLMMIVLDNLINNAFKYANKEVNTHYQNKKIIISNDGEKIDDKDISHIFEPLYKADASRNDTSSIGMGLAIVKNILDLHHFSCKVEQDEFVHFIIEV